MKPQVYARTGGLLYLVIFVMAALSMWLQSRLVVVGDPSATAQHIASSLSQWRLSVAAELVMFGCDIPLALIFYVLLRPVNESLALLAALFRFAEAVIGSAMVVWHVVPLLGLGGATLLYLDLRLYNYGFGIALIPFGVHCVLLGYLIFRSTYLPKTLGVLLVIAGVCYVANSFALIVAPAATGVTFILMLVSGLPAELGIALWLIVKGVNLERWNAVTRGLSLPR